jgi:hypothetical protein
MYPTLAFQAAALGLVLLISGSQAPTKQAGGEPRHALRAIAPVEPVQMRCRLYFGCAPLPIASPPSRE